MDRGKGKKSSKREPTCFWKYGFSEAFTPLTSACRNLTTLMEKEMTKSNVCKRQGGKKSHIWLKVQGQIHK